MMKNIEYRTDIDGLRAIAVLSVILFHYTNGDSILFTGGYVGVDMFFVISGYLITSIIYKDIANNTYSILDFYHRRIRRIFPALFAVFILCLGISFFMNFPSEISEIGKSITASIFFVSNVLFYTQSGYFDDKTLFNPFLHTWSLSVEEQFYIFFPILIFFIKKLAHRTRVIWVFLILITSLIASEYEVSVDQNAAFYLVPFRIWELLLGTILAIGGLPKLENRWQAETLSYLGMAGMVYSVFFYTKRIAFPGFTAFIPCLATAIIIYSGTTYKTIVYRLLSLKISRFFGLISYSLYLWHWPLLVYARYYSTPEGAFKKLALLFACIAISTISWWFVERPFRRQPYVLGKWGVINVAICTMIGLSCLSYLSSDISKIFHNYPDSVETTLEFRNYDNNLSMRTGSCFIVAKPESAFQQYDLKKCLSITTEKKNVLIWGDSHAAHLWFGLQNRYQNVNFLQATSSGCPPLNTSRFDRKNICQQMTKYVLDEFLPKNNVDTIILSGRWYPSHLEDLILTVNMLKKFSNDIVVIGTNVEYDQPLPRILALAVAQNISEHEMVEKHYNNKAKLVDALFKQSLPKNISYISAYEITTSNNWQLWFDNTPVQHDLDHFTKEGSIQFANALNLKW